MIEFIMIRGVYIIGFALLGVTQALLENPDDCCRKTQKMNETCVNSTRCGCVQVQENTTVRCVQCDSLNPDLENLTLCNTTFEHTSISTKIKIAFIFQPSETAVMMPAASSSVRKPRYVRRERPSATTAVSSSTAMPVGHVTKVYNVTVQ
ncbi:uncharacterized protein C1orf159 homolog isoform X3 [Tachysurus fulvidraco]|uniref:uncharacterized protein C1orf159 homolog isoform X3 n=1 Tax=Tachysurus fulvidraco TaxID=1234273 RepID=UPI001FEE7366|nr:uncharacterized protein C1orf159 homolog isoform X3 [Tachysurus fulvidraco]